MTRLWRHRLAPPVLVLAAAILRLGNLDIVEYFHDDAMLATLALELAEGARFPFTGILSSTGIPNPPLSVYIMAIPFAISSHPLVAAAFVMLLNVLGVAALWQLARRYFGYRAAFFAALLYAVNPWAILFSRKIWAQELHAPLILIALILLLAGCDKLRYRTRFAAQAFATPLFLAALQIHFAALALAPLLPLALWMGRKALIRRAMLLAFALSVLVVAPYLVGLAQTLAQDPARIQDAMTRSSERAAALSADSTVAALQLATGLGLEGWVAPAQGTELARGYPVWLPLCFTLLPMLLLGIHALLRRYRHLALLVLCWAFLPFLALAVDWTPVYVHYFIPCIPALMLLIALGVDCLLEVAARMRMAQAALLALIIAVCSAQATQWRAVIAFTADNHIAYPGFTTPLARLLPLRARLRQAEDVIVIGGGMAWDRHHEVAVWDTLLWGDVACRRTIAPEGYALFPRKPFVVVIAPEAGLDPAQGIYQHEAGEVFPMRAGGVDYRVYAWHSPPVWDGAEIANVAPQRFDVGVELTGYGLAPDSIVLRWRLPARSVGVDLQFSAHLLDGDGARLAQRDKTFLHGRHWCAGDALLTWAPISVPEGARTLAVSLYRLGAGGEAGQIFAADVLDVMGKAKGQSVIIKLD